MDPQQARKAFDIMRHNLDAVAASLGTLADELTTIGATLRGKGAHLDDGGTLVSAAETARAGRAAGLKPLEPIFADLEKNAAPGDVARRTVDGQDVEVRRKRWAEVGGKTVPSDVNQAKTVYLGEKEREQYRVKGEEVRTADVQASGADAEARAALGETAGGQGNVALKNGPGFVAGQKNIFSMDAEGNVFAAGTPKGPQDAHAHHSSFLAGEDVAAAGEFITDAQGVVKKVTNRSGHYKPGEEQTHQALEGLEALGVNMDNVRLEQHTAAGTTTGMANEFRQGATAETFERRHALLDEMKDNKVGNMIKMDAASAGAAKFAHARAVAGAQVEADEERRAAEAKLRAAPEGSEEADEARDELAEVAAQQGVSVARADNKLQQDRLALGSKGEETDRRKNVLDVQKKVIKAADKNLAGEALSEALEEIRNLTDAALEAKPEEAAAKLKALKALKEKYEAEEEDDDDEDDADDKLEDGGDEAVDEDEDSDEDEDEDSDEDEADDPEDKYADLGATQSTPSAAEPAASDPEDRYADLGKNSGN